MVRSNFCLYTTCLLVMKYPFIWVDGWQGEKTNCFYGHFTDEGFLSFLTRFPSPSFVTLFFGNLVQPTVHLADYNVPCFP